MDSSPELFLTLNLVQLLSGNQMLSSVSFSEEKLVWAGKFYNSLQVLREGLNQISRASEPGIVPVGNNNSLNGTLTFHWPLLLVTVLTNVKIKALKQGSASVR